MDESSSTYGGDGTSPEEAVVVNCASMRVANQIIDNFISDRHGEKGKRWNRKLEMFHSSPIEDGPTIRIIAIEFPDGEIQNYFFNISRPMEATMDLANIATKTSNVDENLVVSKGTRFYRAGNHPDFLDKTSIEGVFKCMSCGERLDLVDFIARRILDDQGIYGPNVNIVKSYEDMTSNARFEYILGLQNSGGMIQLSMFIEAEKSVYIILPAIQKSAEETGVDLERLAELSISASVITYKGLRELFGDDFEDMMIDVFESISIDKILNANTIDGTPISRAYSDQVSVQNSLSKREKILLAELYLAKLSNNIFRPRKAVERVYRNFCDYVARSLNLQLTNSELEKFLHSSRDYLRGRDEP